MADIEAELEARARNADVPPMHASGSRKPAMQDSTWRLVYEICSMANFNSHAIEPLPWQRERLERTLPPGLPPEVSAVFRVASKAAHACVPNCLSTTCNPCGGCISYYAAHPIAAGDLVTIAYKKWDAQQTLERWAKLARSKDFVCACAQCAGPDVTCGVRCLLCADAVDAAWRCDACGAAPDRARLAAQLAQAERMEARARALADAHLPPDASTIGGAAKQIAELRGTMARARAELCGTHNALSVAAFALAALLDPQSPSEPCADTSDAADAQLQEAAALRLLRLGLEECAAAGCARLHGAARCARVHAVVAGGATDLARAALETIGRLRDPGAFIQQQRQEDPTEVARLARYVPLLACLLGARNNEVLAAAALLELPLPRCADAGPPRCAACLREGRCDARSGSGGGAAGSSTTAAVALLKCGGCGLQAYCSRGCQRRHWKRCHKAVCSKLAAWAGRLEGSGSISSSGTM
ncbi:hypothetical protein JKP88DRAFT_246929 [Tribonema minus]|uniref:MYND-type domain-containing protein n=1 Tax=Tribonema minus TaxID=303371 RepID=A0A836CC60_9STRA|nr:hypothetical protein JKP88DRAFT_246929 [Tribonema minus]